jgi:dTDP-4-dehydrorhamnose reductase
MQTILITGANGFVGQNLVQKLLQKRYKVVATGKGSCRLPFHDELFVFESMDFTEENEVAKVLQKYKPSVLVHGGAWSKPDDCELNKEEAYRINVTGTMNLLRQASHFKSFFIFLSTDFIFTGDQNIYTEESTANPVNYYGQTKMLAEEEVKKYPWDWSIVRTILVYGHCIKGRHNIVSMVADALQNNRALKIVDDQVRTPTYVADLVDGIIKIIEQQATGVFHLSGEDVLTPYQIACAVAKHLQLDESLITRVTQDSFQQPAKRPVRTIFDLSKAKRELGYMPTKFEEGLKNTFLTL